MKEQGSPLLADKVFQSLDVGAGAFQRLFLQLEVAGMDDFAHGRFYADGVAVNDGVIGVEKMETHISKLYRVARPDADQFAVFQKPLLAQLVFHKGQGKGRTVNGHVQMRHKPGQGADVVLMPVRQHNAQNLIPMFLDEVERRDDHVHAQVG